MKRLPIVHVITKLELGGAQQVALDILSGLDPSRFQPHLITGREGYLMERARGLGFPVHVAPSLVREIRPPRDMAAHREIRLLLERIGGVAVVNTHSSKAGIVGRWAAHRARVPAIVHTIHGFGITPLQPQPVRWLLKQAERATSRITTRLVAVSRKTREEGLSWGLYGPEKCTVILCGFDTGSVERARPDRESLKKDPGIPEDAPLVLMAACLKPQKAPVDFVRVAAAVAAKSPSAHFMVAGDGELRGAVINMARELNLTGRFHLLGWREDVFSLMKSADVVVLTSLWEGLPLVIPQAHAAGRPVVATAVDGSSEAIRDGVDGFLCSPGDVGALAESVLRLISDPARARAMGEEGMRSSRRFALEGMVRSYEDLYLELLNEKGLAQPAEGRP